jgi:hypothetical protein
MYKILILFLGSPFVISGVAFEIQTTREKTLEKNIFCFPCYFILNPLPQEEHFINSYFEILIIKSNIRGMRWAWHVARVREERDVYRVLVGKPEGKRPLGRLGCRLEDNIKMDLQ